MDAIKKDLRSPFKSFLKTVYGREAAKPRHPHVEPFHLGWTFDVVVIVVLLIGLVGFFTR